jgi:hypothetical protein
MDAFLIASDNSKYQIWIDDEGSLYSTPYTGSHPFWFNPHSESYLWELQLDEDGTLITVKIS